MSADKQQPVTVHINIPDGNANGIWIVDRDLEWNGSVIVCPRACFETARSMKQFNQPGVYILYHPPDAENPLPKIYIGLADPIKELRFGERESEAEAERRQERSHSGTIVAEPQAESPPVIRR
jgi:hypothetical protein